MSRHDLTDREFNAIRPFLPAQKKKSVGRPWKDHRVMINGILWILSTGSPWRDLPDEFGKWQTVYGRFRRWRLEGLWQRIFAKLLRHVDNAGGIDRSLWCADGTVIRAHRCASGENTQSTENDAKNALGRSQGGYSTKLHVLTDRIGNLLSVTATPGQSHESKEFTNLIEQCPMSLHRKASRPAAIAGDKGYSSGSIRQWLADRNIRDVIPTKSNEKRNPRFPKQLYKQRSIVECTIGWLKESRRIATRYDKLVESYLIFVKLAAIRWMANAY